MIWAVCFTIRVRRRGCAKHLALPKRCSSNSHGMQVWPSIGGRPSLSTLNISGVGETHWRHYGLRGSLWHRFFTRFPDVGRRQRIIKARRGIGLITCVKPRAAGVSIAGASPKFGICNSMPPGRKCNHESFAAEHARIWRAAMSMQRFSSRHYLTRELRAACSARPRRRPLDCSSLTSNIRTELSDTFIPRAPRLRMAARFIMWLDEKRRSTC